MTAGKRFARLRRMRGIWLRLGGIVSLLVVGFLLGRLTGGLYAPEEVALDANIAPAAQAPLALLEREEAVEVEPAGPFAPPSAAPRVGGEVLEVLPGAPERADLPDGYQARPLPSQPERPSEQAQSVMIAVVIDDVGFVEAASEMAIALDPLFTLSFLPYGDHVEKFATQAHAAGHEVLLHMPMQPEGPVDPGPNALLSGLDSQEIRLRLSAAFDRVPQAVGMNNHMGSLLSTDPEAMAVVLDEVMARGLMALDSVTSPDTVIGELAVALGVPNRSRDVFLDNNRDVALINQQLDELERIARANGSAVGLCHPYVETIDALVAWWPAARARGIQLVPLSTLARPPLDHPLRRAAN
jgi:hypothetical protein